MILAMKRLNANQFDGILFFSFFSFIKFSKDFCKLKKVKNDLPLRQDKTKQTNKTGTISGKKYIQ